MAEKKFKFGSLILDILTRLFSNDKEFTTLTNNKLIANNAMLNKTGAFSKTKFRTFLTKQRGIQLMKAMAKYIDLIRGNSDISADLSRIVANRLNQSFNKLTPQGIVLDPTQIVIREIYGILYPLDTTFVVSSMRNSRNLATFIRNNPIQIQVRRQPSSGFITQQQELELPRAIESSIPPLEPIPQTLPQVITNPLIQLEPETPQIPKLPTGPKPNVPTIQAPTPKPTTQASIPINVRGRSFLKDSDIRDITDIIAQTPSLKSRLQSIGVTFGNKGNWFSLMQFLSGRINILNLDSAVTSIIINAAALLALSGFVETTTLNIPLILSMLRVTNKNQEIWRPFLENMALITGISLTKLMSDLASTSFTKKEVKTEQQTKPRATEGTISGTKISLSMLNLQMEILGLASSSRLNLTDEQRQNLQNLTDLMTSIDLQKLTRNEDMTDLVNKINRLVIAKTKSESPESISNIIDDVIDTANIRLGNAIDRVNVIKGLGPIAGNMVRDIDQITSNVENIDNVQDQIEEVVINAQEQLANDPNISVEEKNEGSIRLARLAIAHGFRRVSDLTTRIEESTTLSSISRGVIEYLRLIISNPTFQGTLIGGAMSGSIGGGIAGGVAATIAGPTLGKAAGITGARVGSALASGAASFIPKLISSAVNKPKEPTAQPQPQTREQKRGLLRPKFIIPSDEILDSSQKEIDADEDEWTLFNYVIPSSEGSEGTVKNNPLKAQQALEQKIRFTDNSVELIFTNQESKSVTDKALEEKYLDSEKVTQSLIDSLPVLNFDLFDLEIQPKSWSQPNPQDNPYENYTKINGLNTDIQHSMLYGLVP